jgi:hypothetical protein
MGDGDDDDEDYSVGEDQNDLNDEGDGATMMNSVRIWW